MNDIIDDIAIAKLIRERDRNDTGERLSLEELVIELGFADTIEEANAFISALL